MSRTLPNEAAGREALAQGKVLFVINIPAGFTRQLLRHERPSLLIEADATDPTATGSALAAVNGIVQSVAQREITGPLASLAAAPRRSTSEFTSFITPTTLRSTSWCRD